MLFDWLVTGHIIDVNAAYALRGSKYSVRKGKTPVLSAEEARTLLEGIETDTLIGLRDCALIGLRVYTFARVAPALRMRLEDYFVRGRRGGVRLHEKVEAIEAHAGFARLRFAWTLDGLKAVPTLAGVCNPVTADCDLFYPSLQYFARWARRRRSVVPLACFHEDFSSCI